MPEYLNCIDTNYTTFKIIKLGVKSIFLITCIAFMSACQRQQKNVSLEKNSQTVVDSIKPVNNKDTIKPKVGSAGGVNIQLKNEIRVSFPLDSNSVSFQGHLDNISPVICYLSISGKSKLTGLIEAAKSQANIRFNQIVFPNGQSDGPFEKNLQYTLTQDGIYKVIIGPSLMAENPYTGKFIVHLTIK